MKRKSLVYEPLQKLQKLRMSTRSKKPVDKIVHTIEVPKEILVVDLGTKNLS